MPINGAEASHTTTANASGGTPRPKTGFGMIAVATPKPTRATKVQIADQISKDLSRMGE
jgi:hypothetical protein